MKKTRWIRVVYRNRLFYLLRAFLPKAMLLDINVHGSWKRVWIAPGPSVTVHCRLIRPVRLFDAITFVVVVGGG
jgi:hypothetical protein